MNGKKCPRCGKNRRFFKGEICSECWYDQNYQYTMDQDPDGRDWEWAVCEECGSHLHTDGQCHNTSCGASALVGEDWY